MSRLRYVFDEGSDDPSVLSSIRFTDGDVDDPFERKRISSSILRKIFQGVKAPLTFIFNLSLASGVFPALWKESYILSLLKTGDKRDDP
jgi:hypothetical protein